MSDLVGRLVVAGRGIGTAVRAGKRGNAPGYWVVSRTGDPYPSQCAEFAPASCVSLAVVGGNVCPTPSLACPCPRLHLPAWLLRRLPMFAEVVDLPSPDLTDDQAA